MCTDGEPHPISAWLHWELVWNKCRKNNVIAERLQWQSSYSTPQRFKVDLWNMLHLRWKRVSDSTQQRDISIKRQINITLFVLWTNRSLLGIILLNAKLCQPSHPSSVHVGKHCASCRCGTSHSFSPWLPCGHSRSLRAAQPQPTSVKPEEARWRSTTLISWCFIRGSSIGLVTGSSLNQSSGECDLWPYLSPSL